MASTTQQATDANGLQKQRRWRRVKPGIATVLIPGQPAHVAGVIKTNSNGALSWNVIVDNPAETVPQPGEASIEDAQEQERLYNVMMRFLDEIEREAASPDAIPLTTIPDDGDPIVEKFRRQGLRL